MEFFNYEAFYYELKDFDLTCPDVYGDEFIAEDADVSSYADLFEQYEELKIAADYGMAYLGYLQ